MGGSGGEQAGRQEESRGGGGDKNESVRRICFMGAMPCHRDIGPILHGAYTFRQPSALGLGLRLFCGMNQTLGCAFVCACKCVYAFVWVVGSQRTAVSPPPSLLSNLICLIMSNFSKTIKIKIKNTYFIHQL